MSSVLEKLVEARPVVRVVQAKVFRHGVTPADRARPRRACTVQVIQERRGA